MQNRPLFRQAAIEGNQGSWLGEIVLARPISFTVLTTIAVGMALTLIVFFTLGEYTRRMTVSGVLVPDSGVLKTYSPQAGVVLERKVKEGQSVKKGALLYVISTDRRSSTSAGVQAAISQQVAQRQRTLREEVEQTRSLFREDERALRQKIGGLLAELANLDTQLTDQRQRNAMAIATVKRTLALQAQGFISHEMAQQKRGEVLDQRSRLQALLRDRLSIEAELRAKRSDLTSLPMRQLNQLAQLERQIASTDQELVESDGRRGIEISAAEDGIATAIAFEPGQAIDAARPLVSIIPAGALLQAHLYAPSRAIGFVRPNNHVLLRYHAYPYQKFGHARGIVTSVSKSTVAPNELGGVQPGAVGAEPLYLITVTLDRQSVTAYGKLQPLLAGMLVDADILLEKRHLYEWVLEPLISLGGKI